MTSFRSHTVSKEALFQGLRLGLPDDIGDTIARMAQAGVPTDLGPQYLRCGAFLLTVRDGCVTAIGLLPRPLLKKRYFAL